MRKRGDFLKHQLQYQSKITSLCLLNFHHCVFHWYTCVSFKWLLLWTGSYTGWRRRRNVVFHPAEVGETGDGRRVVRRRHPMFFFVIGGFRSRARFFCMQLLPASHLPVTHFPTLPPGLTESSVWLTIDTKLKGMQRSSRSWICSPLYWQEWPSSQFWVSKFFYGQWIEASRWFNTVTVGTGNLAYETGLPIEQVVQGGTGLAFVSYPDAIGKFNAVPQVRPQIAA